MKKDLINMLPDEELLRLYSKIKPIIEVPNGEMNKNPDIISVIEYEGDFWLREFDLREIKKTSYFWHEEKDKREKVDYSKLKAIGSFKCFHTCAYMCFFKPSIAEVLSQIPKEFNGYNIVAFKIIKCGKTCEEFSSEYHESEVMLYQQI